MDLYSLVDWVWQDRDYATGFRYVAVSHVMIAISTMFQQGPQTSNDVVHDHHIYNIISHAFQMGIRGGRDAVKTRLLQYALVAVAQIIHMRICMLAMVLWIALQLRRTTGA